MGFRFKTLIKEHVGGLNPVYAKYGEAIYKAYPGWDRIEVNELLHETWTRPLVYESVTQFKERPFRGKHVNVDKNGFRHIRNQGPWPPEPKFKNVFVFGGSTTFGYGLPDKDTLPSYLQEALNRQIGNEFRVYNFGRGYYYSTQEMLLFQKLLLDRYKPDVAIFVDGLNEFYFAGTKEFLWTMSLEQCSEKSMGKQVWTLFQELPLTRGMQWVISSIKRRDKNRKDQDRGGPGIGEKGLGKVIHSAIDRYQINQRRIQSVGDHYGVQVFFVWQPISCFEIDEKNHPFAGGSIGRPKKLFSSGYLEMEKRAKNKAFGDNFIWAASFQKGLKGALYVDEVHYSALLCKALAGFIAVRVDQGMAGRHSKSTAQ